MTAALLAPPILGATQPTHLCVPEYASNAAGEACELMAMLGKPMRPWQRLVLEAGLGERVDGSWAAFEVACFVQRQNGKGAITEARELGGLFLFGEQLIIHTAHLVDTARIAFVRTMELIDGSDDLRRRVKRVMKSSGEFTIELLTGAELQFRTRGAGGGRGLSADCLVLDEALYLKPDHVEALVPTMLQRPDPQLWYTSTPPKKPKEGEPPPAILDVRRRGRLGSPRLAVAEWSNELGVDIEDPDVRAAANPEFGRGIPAERFEDVRPTLGEDGFSRECVGIWPAIEAAGGVLNPAAWRDMLRVGAKRAGDVALSLDVAPLLDHASIGMYAPEGVAPDKDGDLMPTSKEHVQVVAYREGVDWSPEVLAEFVAVLDPICVVIHKKNGAHAMLDKLRDVGLTVPDEDQEHPRRGQILIIDDTDAADAVGQWLRTFKAVGFQHIGDQALDAAVENVQARPIGDGGQIGWARRKSEVDIGPLCCVTWPRFGFYAWKDLVTDDYDLLDSVR